MSSGSDSDDEYVPKEPEQLSEEESADEETEEQYVNELEQVGKKRRAVQKKLNKKKKVSQSVKEVPEEVDKVEDKKPQEDEKKREDDLWAMFLEGTDTKPKSTKDSQPEAQPTKSVFENNVSTLSVTSASSTKSSQPNTESDKEREKRIFEFAGETIIVENNVIKEKIKTNETSSSVSKDVPSRGRGAGGLSNVLGQLNKKNKLSTLEKSKLDWDTYKKEEDIDDEIQSHNKGKQGYLERQDFLARADVRQYEIERDLRLSRRSNR